jgi:hypothetical protein
MKCGECKWTKPTGNGLLRCLPGYLDAVDAERLRHPWLSLASIEARVEVQARRPVDECCRVQARGDEERDYFEGHALALDDFYRMIDGNLRAYGIDMKAARPVDPKPEPKPWPQVGDVAMAWNPDGWTEEARHGSTRMITVSACSGLIKLGTDSRWWQPGSLWLSPAEWVRREAERVGG